MQRQRARTCPLIGSLHHFGNAMIIRRLEGLNRCKRSLHMIGKLLNWENYWMDFIRSSLEK
jgi:hypothetical protein